MNTLGKRIKPGLRLRVVKWHGYHRAYFKSHTITNWVNALRPSYDYLHYPYCKLNDRHHVYTECDEIREVCSPNY